MRGSWRPHRTAIYWPRLLWPLALCLSRSPGLLNRRPRGPLCWLSLPHLVSNFSGPQLIRGSKSPFGLMWLSLPQLVYNSVSNCLTSVLTELYNSSTPTQSPTRSLEWHVWSTSSGNNCHAFHRSLSSGLWVYHGIFFTLSHFIRQIPPSRFLSITGHWDVSLPSGASLWNGIFGRVEGQNTTIDHVWINTWYLVKKSIIYDQLRVYIASWFWKGKS